MSANQILNASDIVVSVGGSPIAHITDARISFSHEPRIILSNDTAPGEIKLPGKLTWQMTGTSLIEMSTGYSLGNLTGVMINREPVSVSFSADGDDYSGEAILTSLDGGGATEQNGTCSFTFDSSGDIEGGTAPAPPADDESGDDES